MPKYHKKETFSVYLAELSPMMPKHLQENVASFFINSNYVNNRKRGYEVLAKCEEISGRSEIIMEAWDNHRECDCLELLLELADKQFLIDNWKSISECFEDDGVWYDLYERILRNDYYIKLAEFLSEDINSFKGSDPISYIYIKKGLNQSIDKTFAVEVYLNNERARRYLPTWYAEMGLRDVLEELSQIGLEKPINQASSSSLTI